MKKKLTTNLHFLLSKYTERFLKLKSPQRYAGIIALIEEFEGLKEKEGDAFFEKFGVGNDIFYINKPFERAQAYELLLRILHEYDKKQYLKIHKGTPYFFIGWTAFQYLDFEKALFYMDAAVSEDLRLIKATNSSLETKTPAIDFMLLNPQSKSIGMLLNAQLQLAIVNVLRDFKKASSLDLDIKDFVKSFIKPLLFSEDKKHRSVVTALYCFFIEFGGNKQLIELRSSEGGSIGPLLNHLFKGARILESMVELKGGRGNDLESKIKSLPKLEVDTTYFKGNKTLAAARNTYESLKRKKVSFQDCNFATSYIIRNTTGHSLIWTDEFKTKESYTILYQSLVNSILWSVCRLWIKKNKQRTRQAV